MRLAPSVSVLLFMLLLASCALETRGTLTLDGGADGAGETADGTVDAPDPVECPPGQTPCGGGCATLGTDWYNCGACGNACGGTEVCLEGRCVCPGDAARMKSCGGVCVDTFTDSFNCGACGNACAGGTFCSGAGSCELGCSGGATECGTYPSVYCADTWIDPLNCGRCGNVCTAPAHAAGTCASGACSWMCEPDWVNLDWLAWNGCECFRSSFFESCDGVDNNCTGTVDEIFECARGEESVPERCCASGWRTRTCRMSCTWGNWGECSVPGECEPGAPDSRTCCGTGVQSRTCRSSCRWGDWTPCTTGMCRPGATGSQSCCGTGRQTRTCLESCTWGEWGPCSVPGECVPGTVTNRTCCVNGTQTGTCTNSCMMSWGACSIGVCTPGDHRCSDRYSNQECGDDCSWGNATTCTTTGTTRCCRSSDGTCYNHSHPCP